MEPDPGRVRVSGPLAKYALAFAAELEKLSYPRERVVRHVQLLAQLSRWMERQGLGEGDLSDERVAEFLDAHRAEGYYQTPSVRWTVELLELVPGLGVARAAPAPPTPVESTLADYGRYLVEERGLAAATVRGYLHMARLFLTGLVTQAGAFDLSGLDAKVVTTFVVAESRRRSLRGSQVVVTAIRSLLRFLFVEGRITEPLARAVPAVSAPKGFLPRALDEDVVAALLASCDTSSVLGRRDLALLTVCARLGLRAGEVAGLCLDDVDWRRGELVVRGKGSRKDRLPLPVDVGEAMAAYLAGGRPSVESRALFLRVKAPIRAMSASAVTQIVRRACTRAGVPLAGAHRLRHSAATTMLRAGASLSDIGQVGVGTV